MSSTVPVLRQPAQCVLEAGLQRDHPVVGHRRLGQHAGHVAFAQRGFQRRHVVEGHHARQLIVRKEVVVDVVAHAHLALAQLHVRLFHAAVVGAREHQHARAVGDHPGEPDAGTVRIAGRRGERPVRQAEAALQFFAHPLGITRRQHQRAADARLTRQRFHHRRVAVAAHAAGVAEAEVDVVVAVDVGEAHPIAARLVPDVDRPAADPAPHPVAGRAVEPAFLALDVERAAAGAGAGVLRLLGAHQVIDARGIGLSVQGFQERFRSRFRWRGGRPSSASAWS
jgi:hypothetical protein